MAAAGVGAGVAYGIAPNLLALTGKGVTLSNVMTHAGVGAASSIAGAATRSAIEGSNLGRNIIAGLPDVIGQAIGSAIGGAALGKRREASGSATRPVAVEAQGPIAGGLGPDRLQAALEGIATQTSTNVVSPGGKMRPLDK